MLNTLHNQDTFQSTNLLEMAKIGGFEKQWEEKCCTFGNSCRYSSGKQR